MDVIEKTYAEVKMSLPEDEKEQEELKAELNKEKTLLLKKNFYPQSRVGYKFQCKSTI
ncbi:MAG: hypothetical protein ACKPA8_13960 [Dolichospermum sp.]